MSSWETHMDHPDDMETGAKGKHGELMVISELLKRNYRVYTPVVDSGIDCLVDVGGGSYKEIQIKYREDRPVFVARKFKPRGNFFLICYLNTRRGNDLWVVPSEIFASVGKPVKVRKRDYVQIVIGKEGSESYELMRQYRSNFNLLLTGATKEVRKAVKKAVRRIEGEHFKQPEFERKILQMLAIEANPLQSKEIIRRLELELEGNFSEADLEPGKDGRLRWEKTARFAIYQGLKTKGFIEAKSKNQWVITPKGMTDLQRSPTR